MAQMTKKIQKNVRGSAQAVTVLAIRISRPTQASQPAHTLVASVWPGQWIREKYVYISRTGIGMSLSQSI